MEAATQIFLKSGLPNQFLSQIWRLCLISSTNGLSFPEFCLNMFLIKAKLGGQSIPAVLPENVKISVLNSISSIQHHISVAQQRIEPSNNGLRMPESNSGIAVINNDRNNSSAATSNLNAIKYAPTAGIQIESNNPSAQDRPGWAVSAVDKAKYDAIFKAWDMGNSGFITVCI